MKITESVSDIVILNLKRFAIVTSDIFESKLSHENLFAEQSVRNEFAFHGRRVVRNYEKITDYGWHLKKNGGGKKSKLRDSKNENEESISI